LWEEGVNYAGRGGWRILAKGGREKKKGRRGPESWDSLQRKKGWLGRKKKPCNILWKEAAGRVQYRRKPGEMVRKRKSRKRAKVTSAAKKKNRVGKKKGWNSSSSARRG